MVEVNRINVTEVAGTLVTEASSIGLPISRWPHELIYVEGDVRTPFRCHRPLDNDNGGYQYVARDGRCLNVYND